MTEQELKDYKTYIRPRLNRALVINNAFAPDSEEDNISLCNEFLNILEDLKCAIVLLRLNGKRLNKKQNK